MTDATPGERPRRHAAGSGCPGVGPRRTTSSSRWWPAHLSRVMELIGEATCDELVGLGNAAASAIGKDGLYAAGGVLLLAAVGYLIVRRIEKRVVEKD